MTVHYENEESRDVLCIDVKSFYASVECVKRGLHPLKQMLVVMSHAESEGGLVLASSPKAKEILGISNVTRKCDVPNHKDLLIVPPRMQLYIEENWKITKIYQQYVAKEDLLVYSIDESFLDITHSKKLFGSSAYEVARKIQRQVFKETGLYVTIGIGENPLMAKLALDNGAKHRADFIAEWRFKDVEQTIWKISPLTEMWGIGYRTAKRLKKLGISSVYELAHANPFVLKDKLGVIGEQLFSHAWGIDRSHLSDFYLPEEKSYGNSQILPRDYAKQEEIEVVIREMAEQVATRIRKRNAQTQCIHLYVGYSYFYQDKNGQKGFSVQMKIPATNKTRLLTNYCLELFRKYYTCQEVKHIGITYSKLMYSTNLQLDLFQDSQKQVKEMTLDLLIDKIRQKYGYTSLIHANSLLNGGTAISRAGLVGGHAGGLDGMEIVGKDE